MVKAVRPDNNNIEMEKELLALGKNSTEFNFLTQVISNDIRSLRMAIVGKNS